MNDIALSEAEQVINELMKLHPKGYDMTLGGCAVCWRCWAIRSSICRLSSMSLNQWQGSVSAFCRALLEAAGHAVHVHTSPHLVNWHERYRIGSRQGPGQLVEDALLADALRRVAVANAGEPITVFEILTAAGFLLFSEIPADAVISGSWHGRQVGLHQCCR